MYKFALKNRKEFVCLSDANTIHCKALLHFQIYAGNIKM